MSSSMNNMERSSDLPHQLIMDEILIRLPVKSLCRFKAVCKLWNDVISRYQFAKAHFDHNRQLKSNSKWVFFQHGENSWLLDYEAYDDRIAKPFDFSNRENINTESLISLGKELNSHLNGVEVAPFGSSRGLVCLQVVKFNTIVLCNPLLRQFRSIPAPCSFITWDIFLCGFGYVSSIDDFKLILGLEARFRDETPMICVFSLRNNSWRIIEGDDNFHILAGRMVDRRGILVNEYLHWWTGIQNNNYDGRIFAFDLLYEVFQEVPIPEELVPRVRFSTLGSWALGRISVIEGCLCLLILQDDNVELWMLKQYGDTNSWVRLYNLYIPSTRTYYLLGECFGFTRTGKFIVWGWDELYKCFIFLVDPNQPHLKFMIGNFGGVNTGIVNFAESLICPFGMDDATPQGAGIESGADTRARDHHAVN